MPARSGPPLSRDRVLRAALALADDEGVGAVTMRRVADSLDCEAMSLYYYVRDKTALLAGLAETVAGEVVEVTLDPALVDEAADWREIVRRRCLAARSVMLRHPWAPGLLATQTTAPASSMAIFEGLVATMVEGGCDYSLAHRAIHALGSMLMGFTQELFEPDSAEQAPTEEELAALASALPHLARIAEVAAHERAGSLSVCDTQAEFEFTLGLLLDGLEARRVGGAPEG